MTATASENHAKFLNHLNASIEPVFRVAQWLCSKGHDIYIPGLKRASHPNQWQQFADSGDLFLVRDGNLLRLEVKRLGVNFTGPNDWPFGNRFIVCAKHSFDRADPAPHAYIILSKDMHYAAVSRSCDRNLWKIDRIQDRRYQGISQEFYLSPLSAVRWTPIDPSQQLIPQG